MFCQFFHFCLSNECIKLFCLFTDKVKHKAHQKSPPPRKYETLEFYFLFVKINFICLDSFDTFVPNAIRKDSDNLDESDDDGRKAGKLSLKKKGIGSEARVERLAKADSDLQLLNKAEQERQLQKQRKRRHQGREDSVCLYFIVYLHFTLSKICITQF